jgi:hypothetical protein
MLRALGRASLVPGLLGAGLVILGSEWLAADVPDAVLTLEASTPFAPGQDWGSAPARFVLLEDGQVFVGGSQEVLAGRLEKAEVKALETLVEAVRKMPGLAPVISLGSDEPAFRLRASKKPLDVRFTGDLAMANPAFRPLTSLLEQLLRFEHPSLRPYAPAAFALRAQEATRPGGCRLWTLDPTPAEAANGAIVPAAAITSWTPGVYPTSVCAGDKRYEVRLRPLLPGERP